MKKKVLLALLAIVMVLCMIGVCACNNKQDEPNKEPEQPTVETYVVTVVGGTGSGNYKSGETVTISAPNKGDGYTFVGWYEGEEFISEKTPYEFKATRNITLTATYSFDEYYYLSANEKGDFTNDKTRAFVPRNEGNDAKAFDHWPTVISDDANVKSPLSSDKSLKIVIEPTLDSTGAAIVESAVSFGGVWSTIDFGFMGQDVNVFDYKFIEFDLRADNAQNWASVRFVDADGNLSTEMGTDNPNFTVTRINENWYHYSYDIASFYDFAFLTDEDQELENQVDIDNYDAISDAQKIRICVSNADDKADWKLDSIIHVDNLTIAKTAADVEEYVPSTVKYTVTVTDGAITGATDDNQYVEGAEITVTADTKEHKTFAGWSDGANIISTDNPYTFVVSADLELTATYNDIKFEITVTDGTIANATDDNMYVEGSSITVTAATKEGSFFTGWSDGTSVVSTANPYTFTVSAAVALSAQYSAEDPTKTYYDVIVKADGETPAQSRVEEDAKIELVPSVISGYRFDKWIDGEGNDVTVDAENKYTVTGNITIIATFVQQYTVTVVNGDETQDVDAGEEITIVADEPEDGYEFLGWKKNNATEYISTDTSYTFEVTESATYTAVFAAIEGDDLITNATITSKDGAQAYNVRTTDKDGNDTVALKITAEAGCGYPNVVLDIDDFDMMTQTLAFNIKVASGHPWYALQYLDESKVKIGGEVGGDVTANTWVTVSRDEKVANAKYIKFIFNAENPAKGDIEVYIDAMALTNRPTIHPDAVTYSGSSYYFPTYKLMAADWAGKAVTFEFYMEEGTFRFNMNDGDHGWKQWASDIVFTRTGDAVTTTAGAVVSTENAGWYKFIINTSTFATPEGADAFSMIAHSAAYTTSVFKVDPATIEIIDEVYHINTKTYAGERIYFAECGVASIMSSNFADKAFTFEFTMKEGSCYIDIIDLDHGWAQWLGGVTFTRSGDTVTVSDKKGKVESVGNGWYKYSVNTYYFADLASPADRISGFACNGAAATAEFTIDLDTIKLEEKYRDILTFAKDTGANYEMPTGRRLVLDGGKNQSLYFEYKLENGADGDYYEIRLQDTKSGWQNVSGNFTLRCDGTVNKNANVVSLGDGWYGVYFSLASFNLVGAEYSTDLIEAVNGSKKCDLYIDLASMKLTDTIIGELEVTKTGAFAKINVENWKSSGKKLVFDCVRTDTKAGGEKLVLTLTDSQSHDLAVFSFKTATGELKYGDMAGNLTSSTMTANDGVYTITIDLSELPPSGSYDGTETIAQISAAQVVRSYNITNLRIVDAE